MSSSAGIVIIGNEVLSGKVEEENARYLIRELRDLGVQLQRIVVIRDDVARIAKDVREMSAEVTHVFTSGGVGATHDDVTMRGVAEAFGVPLQRNAALAELIRGHYRERKSDGVLRMADLPDGAELLGVDRSPFPVVKVRNVYVLPGVPAYFRMKFEFLRDRLRDSPFFLRQIFVSVGESAIAEVMAEVQTQYPDVEIGSYPRHDSQEFRVKVTLESRDAARVEAAVQALSSRFDPAWIVRRE